MISPNETVTVVRAPGTITDRYNNVVPDWDNAAEFAGLPANVQPMTSQELIQDRETLATYRHLWADWPRQDLVYTDRVIVRGLTYEVDGDVEEWRTGSGLHHYHAVLRRVT